MKAEWEARHIWSRGERPVSLAQSSSVVLWLPVTQWHMLSPDVWGQLWITWVRVGKCNGSLYHISEKSQSFCFDISSNKRATNFYYFVRKLFFVLIPNFYFGISNHTSIERNYTQISLDLPLFNTFKYSILTFNGLQIFHLWG